MRITLDIQDLSLKTVHLMMEAFYPVQGSYILSIVHKRIEIIEKILSSETKING